MFVNRAYFPGTICYNYFMSEKVPSTFNRRCCAAAVISGALALALYAYTAAPELPPGHDSAELIAAAVSGGIAHPPGYPLYTMLGHAAAGLNPGNPIYALNLFSAVCGALAAALAAWAFSRFSGSAWGGALAALIFAAAATPWRLSVGAEVFALHLAFAAALLALTAQWQADPGPNRVYWAGGGAFVFGLACAHHQTIALLLLPLGLFFWLEHRRSPQTSLGFSLWMIPLFLLGLLPYLYLPWKAAQHPPINWGDPSSWERFFWVVLRQGYGGTQLSTVSHQNGAVLYHLGRWCRSLVWLQFPVIAWGLGIFGAVKAWKERRSAAVLLGAVCLLYGPVWCAIAAQPEGDGFADMLERFYAASYLGFAGLIALGIAACLSEGKVYAKTGAVLAVSAVLLGLGLNWGRASGRGLYVISDAVSAMTDSVPAGAVVITCNDLTSGAFMYASAVEGRDFVHIPAGLAYSQWFREQLEPYQAQAIAEGGIEGLLRCERLKGRAVMCEAPLPGVRGFFVPYGLMYKYLAPGEPLPDRLQASIESLMYLENFPRRDAGRDYSRQPFWAGFYVQRWKEAYRVLVGGLPPNSKMRAAAEEKAR